MILAKYLFVAAFFIISFLFSYAFIRIFFDHRRWIKAYFQKQRQYKILKTHFPLLLLQLSSFLKAGHALPQALKIISKSENGQLLSEALLPTKNKTGDNKLDFFISFLKQAIVLSTRNGIPLSPLLEQISKLYQTEVRFREKIVLLTFPAKAQAMIAVLLPWFILVIFGFIAPNLIIGALTQTAGMVGFSTALVMDGVALKWVQKITHS